MRERVAARGEGCFILTPPRAAHKQEDVPEDRVRDKQRTDTKIMRNSVGGRSKFVVDD